MTRGRFLRKRIEANFRKIFLEIIHFLREGNLEWDGKEIPDTIKLLSEAKLLSIQVMENRFLHHDDFYYTYFSIWKSALKRQSQKLI